MGIASIVGDIGSVVDGVLNAFGAGSGDTKYPLSLGNLVSNKIVENDGNWKKSLGYAFEVVRVKNGAIVQGPAGPGGNETWKPFYLQINPQELGQDEIFAIQVTPTFSGVLVEHQGSTLKEISISGTTGLSPNRRDGGAFPQSGRPVFAAGHSGYYEFHELRTYFRAYVEQKRVDPGSKEGELRLIWRNLRDHEHLFVEPQKFSMKRSARRATLYDYDIQLVGIGIAEDSKAGKKDYLADIDNMLASIQDGLDVGVKLIQGSIGFVERVERDVTNTLLNPVRSVAAALRELSVGKQRIARVAGRVGKINDRAKATLDVGKLLTPEDKKNASSKASNEFKSTYEESSNKAKEEADAANTDSRAANKKAAEIAAALNKEKIKELALKAQEIYDNLADQMGIDTAAYNAAKGRIATLKSDIINRNLTYEQAKTLYGIKVIKVALSKMTATDQLFKKTLSADQKLVDRLYNDALKSKETSANLILKTKAETALAQAKASGDLAAIKTIRDAQQSLAKEEAKKVGTSSANQSAGKTAKAVVIGGGDNIQTIAAKYLGSPDNFRDLVIFNSLKPPYINTVHIEDDPIRVSGVLRPGDTIYVPTSGGAGKSYGTVRNDGYPISKDLSENEKNFGIDIKLTDDYDIEVSNTGDVKLIAGSNNVAQGLLVKLLLESGALQRHPEIGGGLEIGGKSIDISQTLQRVRQSLEKDARVQNVIFAEIRQEGSSTILNLVLKLKNVDQPVSVPVKVA